MKKKNFLGKLDYSNIIKIKIDTNKDGSSRYLSQDNCVYYYTPNILHKLKILVNV